MAEAHRWDIRDGLKMSVDNARSLLITLVSSFTQPENGALLSIATTTRHGVINTEVYLRIHMALLSSLAEQDKGLVIILGHPLTALITQTQQGLRVAITMFRRRSQHLYSLCLIPPLKILSAEEKAFSVLGVGDVIELGESDTQLIRANGANRSVISVFFIVTTDSFFVQLYRSR